MSQIILGDCLEVMPGLKADSIDLICTDPPYGLKFMGKEWDHGVPGVHFWKEALRVAKPGAHLMAFGGTRTFHRLAVAIEDAGWEIRDCVMWVYGSGFPKSLDVSKAIDKAAGAEREVVGQYARPDGSAPRKSLNKPTLNTATPRMAGSVQEQPITAPATDAAKQWEGWGTALKPAWEPIILARKPLIGTVAENVLRHGTGGINVDECRVECEGKPVFTNGVNRDRNRSSYDTGGSNRTGEISTQGRWPANLIHDGSDEVVGLFPVTTSGNLKPCKQKSAFFGAGGEFKGNHIGDTGSAARFFYCAKASPSERGKTNKHPTVKPLALMRYLITLGLPPGGTVLDPFAGSGTTALACKELGRNYICIEKSPDYYQMILERITEHELRSTCLIEAFTFKQHIPDEPIEEIIDNPHCS